MKILLLALLLVPGATLAKEEKIEKKSTPASATFKVHPCEADAIAKADKLLRLHHADDSNAKGIPDLSVADKVTKLAPIKELIGQEKFDALQVNGVTYGSLYCMRFIYA
jgi:hypothetical protein